MKHFGGESKDYTKNLNRQKQNPSGLIVHENYGKFRTGTSIVDNLVLNEDKEDITKKSSNHLLKAQVIEKK